MFEIFKLGADYWLVALLLMLLLGPPGFYLRGSWAFRKQEILGALSPSSVQLYFKTFYPGMVGAPRDFERFYHTRFGRHRYIIPLLVLAATGWVASTWTIRTVLVWTNMHPSAGGTLDPVSVSALSGGYVWVVADLIARWRSRDLSPADLWWASWRLVLAVPLAYAVSFALKPEIAVAIAFLLGAFPTRSISTMARRLAKRQLNLGADSDEKGESELERLQGVDPRIAERFADEGVTTIVQLAYSDPVELTMRCASFTFSFVVDCASQALAWLYLEDNLTKLRVCSLRGAQEVASLIEELDGDDPKESQLARETVTAAAGIAGLGVVAFERTLREIADDPYTEFMTSVWEAAE